ncbi:MAG: hypothetical protein J2P31_01525 [Blastocatellia bacterium]|nr:hypothetical protein [Blastocatellia bacterium]
MLHMERDRESEIKRAAELWHSGEPYEAGRIIFEGLPEEVRPAWATGILHLVLERTGVKLKQIDRLLEIVDRPEEWRKAHQVFSSIRGQTLKWDELAKHELTTEQRALGYVLELAELVAKVTYNATDPDDEFDEDSGWGIASILRNFVDRLNDENFAQVAWLALSKEPPTVKEVR